MTQTGMLALIRNLLNEASAGFWTDTQLYAYITDGQDYVCDTLIHFTNLKRKTEPLFYHPSLETALDTKTINLTAADVSKTFSNFSITAYRKYDSCFLDLNNSGSKKRAIYSNPYERLSNSGNTYGNDTINKPSFYVSGTTVYFNPACSVTTTNGIQFVYYLTFTAVSSGQNLTLGQETHNAIMYYALYSAFMQDKDIPNATKYLTLFQTELQKLLQ